MKLKQRIALAYRIIRAKPGNLYSHAQRELSVALPTDGDMNDMMTTDVLEMIQLFGTQGHSGMSASYAAGLISDLLAFKPLSPLTGAEDEWTALEYCDDMAWQNKRCSHVFRRADGTAYDSTGRLFEEPNGLRYQGSGSQVDITFPYTPTVEIVKREYAT